MIRRNVAKDY